MNIMSTFSNGQEQRKGGHLSAIKHFVDADDILFVEIFTVFAFALLVGQKIGSRKASLLNDLALVRSKLRDRSSDGFLESNLGWTNGLQQSVWIWSPFYMFGNTSSEICDKMQDLA
jgi:hypothetical protein